MLQLYSLFFYSILAVRTLTSQKHFTSWVYDILDTFHYLAEILSEYSVQNERLLLILCDAVRFFGDATRFFHDALRFFCDALRHKL